MCVLSPTACARLRAPMCTHGIFFAAQGFVAKPATLADGAQDILNWEVVIPGKEGTIWEGARIPMTMTFTEDYPNKPPICKFKLLPSTNKPLFHPNVYPSGKICLSLLDPDKVRACEFLSVAIRRVLFGS